VRDLNRALGSWYSGSGPAYERLAGALKAAIERGEIGPGARLPAERVMATTLSLSRTTVTAAYELLRSQGFLASRQGSGTFVRRRGRQPWPAEASEDLLTGLGSTLPSPSGRPGLRPIEFLAAAFPATDILTADTGAALISGMAAAADSHGYIALGLPALRAAIADHLSATALPTLPEQILVTNGAQEATFLAAMLLVSPGDRVLIEDPTWLGAIDAYRTAGGEVVGIPTGPEGIDVRACGDLIGRHSPALVHLSPSFNNPTGFAMSQRGRVELATLLNASGIPLVEDSTLADLGLNERRLPPVAAIARNSMVLSVGSVSKLFWGGLRVGWIRAPEPIIYRLAQLKLVVDHSSSLPSQALALALFDRVDSIRTQRREQAAHRLGVLQEGLRQHLPEWRWRTPDGGLSLWVQLPRGLSVEFCQLALRHGVVLIPGSRASPHGAHADSIRLPFVAEPEVLLEGVRRLAEAWREYDHALDRRSVRQVIV